MPSLRQPGDVTQSRWPRLRTASLLVALCLSVWPWTGARAAPVEIVAAEGFYGDVAAQIAGPDAVVSSILSNPDQDPHLFEPTASVARRLAGAGIVICNGLDYDPWMTTLLAASRRPGRAVLVAADLAGREAGSNPHIWYDPATMGGLARALSLALIERDGAHASSYRAREAAFEASLLPIEAHVAALRTRIAGMRVTATEPIAGDMFQALALDIRNMAFQRAVMNSAEPGASEIAAFETSLTSHQVRLLLYNSQATDPTADRMVGIARAARIPVVAATESLPAGLHYQAWIAASLDALDGVLAGQAGP